MHDDLQRRGRRRLIATSTAGVALLSVSFALLVFPFVIGTVLVLGPLFRDTTAGALGLAVVIALAVGAAVAIIATALAWHHAERDALRSAQLQLATVPGAAIDVVPSWRVESGPLPRLRTTLDTLAIAAGTTPPRCAVVVDPAPNLLSIGRHPDTAWIVCTTGLLDELPRRELEALLAYALGRVACREVSLDTVVYACTRGVYESWAASIAFDEGGVLLLPFAVLALPLVAACALLRRSALSARAHLSDGLALQFTRDPVALVAALRRIANDGRTVRFAGTPNAHLWLAYPHTRASRWLLGTGRLLETRIRRIERMGASFGLGATR